MERNHLPTPLEGDYFQIMPVLIGEVTSLKFRVTSK